MVTTTQWIHEPHICSTTFDDETNVGELNNVMVNYLHKVQDSPTYFVLDFTGIHVPEGLLRLPALLQVINHANTKWMAIVKAETSSSYMTKMLSRDKVKMFRDADTAIHFLESMVRVDSGKDLTASV